MVLICNIFCTHIHIHTTALYTLEWPHKWLWETGPKNLGGWDIMSVAEEHLCPLLFEGRQIILCNSGGGNSVEISEGNVP